MTISAPQKRERERIAYDAFFATCPTRQVMATIANKWVGLVMTALSEGPRRHGELARTIAGASQKMLTQTLRTLERDGLVRRELELAVPVRVTYSLTPLGESLAPVMRALKSWSEENIEDVLTARDDYDRRPPATA